MILKTEQTKTTKLNAEEFVEAIDNGSFWFMTENGES